MKVQDDVQIGTMGKLVDVSGTVRVAEQPHGLSSLPVHRSSGAATTDGMNGKQDVKLRQCWESTMCQEMQIPEGYKDVFVLIIKWHRDLDELKTEDEVGTLEQLFKEKFNYSTKILELDIVSKPQHQLNTAISSALKEFDGPHNLVIVYYTGHGSWNVNKEYLELHASSDENKYKDADYEPHAIWNSAERPLLEDADCDVLAIMDTCFASNIWKGLKDTRRAYLLLAASGHDKQTAGPGPNSFTTALIKSLEDSLKENNTGSFAVRALCDRINLYRRGTKANNQSQVLDRLKSYSTFINLTPLRNSSAERKDEFEIERTRAFLTLNLSLTEALDEKATKALAKDLSQAAKKHRVKRVDWTNHSVIPTFREMARFQGLQWKYGRKWKEITTQSQNKVPTVPTNDQGWATTPSLFQVADDLGVIGSSLARSEYDVISKKLKRKHSDLQADPNKIRETYPSPEYREQEQGPMTPRSDTERNVAR